VRDVSTVEEEQALGGGDATYLPCRSSSLSKFWRAMSLTSSALACTAPILSTFL